MTRGALLVVLLSGVLFGFGLAISTMTQPEVILSFLRFQDFGLLFVLGGAAVVTGVAYQFGPRMMSRPVLAPTFSKHPSEMSVQTIGGAALFGVGWGLCGVCPGPAIAGLGTGNWPLLIAVVAMFAGAYAQGWMVSRRPPVTRDHRSSASSVPALAEGPRRFRSRTLWPLFAQWRSPASTSRQWRSSASRCGTRAAGIPRPA